MNPILALIITNVIWGAASPIFKLALTNIPPFTLAFIRFFYRCPCHYSDPCDSERPLVDGIGRRQRVFFDSDARLCHPNGNE